jgi:hypothetical protein
MLTPLSLRLAAQRERKRIEKRLGAVIHRLVGAEHKAGDRAGDQDASPAGRAHVAPDLLDQVERAGDVGVDDAARRGKILIEKRFAEAAPGVGQQRTNAAAAERRQ